MTKRTIISPPFSWEFRIAALYVAYMLATPLYYLSFQNDFDEGFTAMKSALMLHGYSLYRDIWNDQPPLLSYLLCTLWRVTGESILAGRALELFFAALLLWAGGKIVRNICGEPHGIIATLLITQLLFFQFSSVTLTIGLPALALAMCALLCVMEWGENQEKWRLYLAALLLILAALTKFIALLLLPVMCAGIALSAWGNKASSKKLTWLFLPALWATACVGILAALLFAFAGTSVMQQLIRPHILARNPAGLNVFYYQLYFFYPRLRWIYLLSLTSLPLLAMRRYRQLFYLVAWAALAFIVLKLHHPIRWHQHFLLTIPLALLSGAGLGEFVRVARKTLSTRVQSTAVAAALSCIIIASLTEGVAGLKQYFHLTSLFELQSDSDTPINAHTNERAFKIVQELKRLAHGTLVVTDVPLLALEAGSLVPPYLAVFSDERVQIGNLTEDIIIKIIKDTHPKALLFGRFINNRFATIHDSLLALGYSTVNTVPNADLYALEH